MAKLQRKSAKLFAENANAGIGGVAQFGSLAAGTPNYSKDVDVIQALDAYKNGWSSATTGNKSPAMEDRNALDYLLSYQQAYIMQHGVPEWIGTETYYEHSYVVDSNGELRVSTIDNNIGHDPAQDNGGAYWGYAGARGSGKQIGEVYFSQSSSAVDNKGALPLFTGEVISNADQIYPQFYAWVLAHMGLCVTEEQYQSALSTYGECPKYVIDDTNKTLRLPKLVNYIKMANLSDGISQREAGLPDISVPTYSEGGAEDNKMANGGGNPEKEWSASAFNSIYGKSNTVTPAHTTVFPWVFAYNAAMPASMAQAAEFQEALSSKADRDLSNVPTAVLSTLISNMMPNYTQGVARQKDTQYTADVNGWVSIHAQMPYQGQNTKLVVNGETVVNNNNGYDAVTVVDIIRPIAKGDVWEVGGTNSNVSIKFYPCNGGI